MGNSIAVQEPIVTGLDSFQLSPEKLAEIKAKVRAEQEELREMKAVDIERHQAQMQAITDARRERVAAGREKRNQAQLDMIRRMDAGEREHFKIRCNNFTPQMLELLGRLDRGEEEPEGVEPSLLQSLGTATDRELQAELHRRAAHIGEPPQQPSPSQQVDENGEKAGPEVFDEENNALSDEPPRPDKERASGVVPAKESTPMKPGRPPGGSR